MRLGTGRFGLLCLALASAALVIPSLAVLSSAKQAKQTTMFPAVPRDAFLTAIARGHEGEFVKLLGEHGKTFDQRTLAYALKKAARYGLVTVIVSLLDFGVAVDVTEADDETALMIAAAGGQTAAVDLLLSRGARHDRVDMIGWTPLFYAAAHNQFGTAQLLLRHGASANDRDFSGLTPLDHARTRPLSIRLPILGAFAHGRVPRFRSTALIELLKRKSAAASAGGARP